MKKPNLVSLADKSPKNWNRWGPTDELGCLNYLTDSEVLRGLRSVKHGKVFTLSLPICGPRGDPVTPDRTASMRFMVRDQSDYSAGKATPAVGGFKDADDYMTMFVQGTTHVDALAHPWCGEKVWNGYSADTTIGGLEKASIMPIGEHGIVGCGVLLDIARFRRKEHLHSGEIIELEDLKRCAEKEKIAIEKHDILLVRTGWMKVFYEQGQKAFFEKGIDEPGITYSNKLLDWFHKIEIPVLGTDTLANEASKDPRTQIEFPLHVLMIRNLGIIFNEMLWLEDLAEDCARDKQYRFFYVASPLKICKGTGSPVNPIVMK